MFTDEELKVCDIRHTVPQHRQYLSYEGVGFGTPSQRYRQYQQYRVHHAAENIQGYTIEKLARDLSGEKAVVEKDNALVRQYKTR